MERTYIKKVYSRWKEHTPRGSIVEHHPALCLADGEMRGSIIDKKSLHQKGHYYMERTYIMEFF